MRLFPILTAIVVVGVLFLLVFQRDTLLSFSGAETEEVEPEVIEAVADRDVDAPEQAVSVVAMRSTATSIDGAVILRGRTEAARPAGVCRAIQSGHRGFERRSVAGAAGVF